MRHRRRSSTSSYSSQSSSHSSSHSDSENDSQSSSHSHASSPGSGAPASRRAALNVGAAATVAARSAEAKRAARKMFNFVLHAPKKARIALAVAGVLLFITSMASGIVFFGLLEGEGAGGEDEPVDAATALAKEAAKFREMLDSPQPMDSFFDALRTAANGVVRKQKAAVKSVRDLAEEDDGDGGKSESATSDEDEAALIASTLANSNVKFVRKLVNQVTHAATNNDKRRAFGCLRETCRGLEIEDLLDRGFHNRFRTAIDNNTQKYRDLKYKVTFLLTDTTQLNHMKSTRPDMYSKISSTYEGSTYVVAFEGGDAVGGNKGYQLRSKDRFARAHGCDYDSLAVQPPQYRLYIKSECTNLLRRAKNDPTLTWILKPETGSQGQGITFHQNVKEIVDKLGAKFFPCQTLRGVAATERYLVQSYIQQPLLLKKCKFDARVYMFIASSNPYLVFYHSGYLRRALTPYSPSSRDRKAYLTNTHYQSSRQDFNMSNHIWTFDLFQDAVQHEAGPSFVQTVLEPNIKEVALLVFESARAKLVPRRGTTQIVGLDFMVDSDYALHFLEANGYPGFTWSIHFDSRGLVSDLFDLSQELHESPAPFRAMRSGDRFGGFHLVHTDLWPDHPAKKPYDPCEALSDNAFLSKSIKYTAHKVSKGMKKLKPESRSTSNSAVEPWMRVLLTLFPEYHDDRARIAKLLVSSGEDIEGDCASLIVKYVRLYDESECEAFIQSPSQPSNTIVVVRSLTTNKEMLFPTIRSFAESWGSCTGSERRMFVARLASTKTLSVPLLRVAYPAGKEPIPTFSLKGDDEARTLPFAPSPLDPVVMRAVSVEALFGAHAGVRFEMRWFMLLAKPARPTLVLSHPGYARSVRRKRCLDQDNQRFETFLKDEVVLSAEEFGEILAYERLAPAQYLSSAFESFARRAAELLLASMKVPPDASERSALFALDFSLGADLRPQLIGIEHVPNEADVWGSMPPHEAEEEPEPEEEDSTDFDEDEPQRKRPAKAAPAKSAASSKSLILTLSKATVKKILERIAVSRKKAEVALESSSLFFVRARRGDAFEGFRVVYSELEERRFEPTARYKRWLGGLANSTQADGFDLCKLKFPPHESLKKAVGLENFAARKMNARRRDLRKRVLKKWVSCRHRGGAPDVKQRCITPTLQTVYMAAVRRDGLVEDRDHWVKETFELLMSNAGRTVSGGDETV